MIEPKASLGRQVGEKAIRLTIAVIGLLLLRVILSALPMTRHPIVYLSPAATQLGAGVPMGFDLNGILREQKNLEALPPAEMLQLQQAFGAIALAQGQDFEKTYNQVAGMNASLGKAMADVLTGTHFIILPITIANAVIDTLIFTVLLVFGREVNLITRSSVTRLPETGTILNLLMAAIVVLLAYNSYKGILYPFLLPDYVDLYGWVFLVLGLVPLVGIAVLVAQNMDAVTAAVMRVGTGRETGAAPITTGTLAGTGSVTCTKCGHAVSANAKFCPNCATPVSSNNKRFCGSCGSENAFTTKFCGECGLAMTD